MSTLYRKYRPQKFSEVLGQNHIKITLEYEVSAGKTAHAYLFCGPRAIGKTTVARILAKALNCESRKENESEPCNKCQSCLEITNGKSLDISEIDAASHTSVDNVRESIIASSKIAPSRSKNKIFIIDEVHMLSISAFNALLKILEEPPVNVFFILCTTEVHKIPLTIISRCQRFDFKRISLSEIAKKLASIAQKEGIKIDKKIIEAIARQSDGHMRDAESLLGQVVAVGGKEITEEEADLVVPRSDISQAVKLIDFLSKKDAGNAINLVNKLIDEGLNLKKFLTDTVEILRKIMIYKINPELGDKFGLEFGETIEIQINQVSRGLSVNQTIVFLEKLIKAKNDIKNNFIIQLPVEIAIVELTTAPSPANNCQPTFSQPKHSAGQTNTQTTNSQTTNFSSPDSQSDNKKTTAQAVVDKNLISSKWTEVLAKIKQHNHSLSFILRVCQPKDINNNRLCLAFKYKFHKDRVEDINIKKMVEKVIKEVYGADITIEAVIDENIEVANGENGTDNKAENLLKEKEDGKDKGNEVIDNLLKTFGGKIIN